MAGGKGTRLKMGEKPLATLLDRPLLAYVVDALEESRVKDVYVAVTSNVPATRAWAEDRGLGVVKTAGTGYVADMVQGVKEAGIVEPVLIVMADLPLLTGEILEEVLEVYSQRSEPALSVHTSLALHRRLGRRPDSLFNYHGKLIVPAGVNVLDGSKIEEEQEDYHLISERVELAVNVNTAEDLELCGAVLRGEV